MNAPLQPAGIAATPPGWLRQAVRDHLQSTKSYQDMAADKRRELAHAMVRVSQTAAQLIDEERRASEHIEAQQPRKPPQPLARAQDAPGFGAATDRLASTTQSVLNAVSFPRFVTDLINGVFRAMLDSTSQQMQMYVQLLNNVSASLDGFSGTQFSNDGARHWLADHFPDAFQIDNADSTDPDNPPELNLRDGGRMPDQEALRTVFGMEPTDTIDAGNPEQLVPLARRQMARQRQQMLSTMVMMGMQRIVVDSGKINAAMHFHIDTRSAAQNDSSNSFNFQNKVSASGSFGVGPWGASASVENTIGYVSTQRSQSTEEMNTDLDLSSSVEINFRSDYLPLNRMAAQAQADRIRANTINPDAEAAALATERQARHASDVQSDTARRQTLTDASAAPRPSTPPPPAAGAPRPSPATTGPTPTPAGGPAPTSGPPPTGSPASTGGPTPTGSPSATPAHSPTSPSPTPSATPAPVTGAH
ncbi:hypothetical protein [Andreprevotia chitinilytica]|uniref:hypothetical protein n=1 Tax=Andreprevotia chitinilytica TaxID=396808 RepID=UPI00054E70F4|nr:hypothetical protein [Andreprevotia chitinilytica]